MSLVTNQQLFSAVYLRELQQGKHATDALDGARQTIKEYREDSYAEFNGFAARRAYAKQCLSTLMVANSPRPEQDGFVLFADVSKVEATGLCLVVEDEDLGRAVKGPPLVLIGDAAAGSFEKSCGIHGFAIFAQAYSDIVQRGAGNDRLHGIGCECEGGINECACK